MFKNYIKKFLQFFRKDYTEQHNTETIESSSVTKQGITSNYRSKNDMPEYDGDGKICPLCGSADTRTISYGMIRFNSDEAREEFQKTSISGGCVTDDNSPKYVCNNCDKRFGLDEFSSFIGKHK